MSDQMSAADFLRKVRWEGGIIPALDYGLKHTDLDPSDSAASRLREAWQRLEHAYTAPVGSRVLAPIREAIAEVEEALEEIETRGAHHG